MIHLKSLVSIFALLILTIITGAALAAPDSDETPELYVRMGLMDIDFEINDDGSYTDTRTWEMTVLKEQAVENAKQYSFSYSTSIQTAEVLEAYTRKSDGKKIKVPQDNFQVEINKGKGKDSPIFSDRTQMTVVFPDVSVGDTVVFSYKVIAKEPMFPNQFSTEETFHKTSAIDKLHIKIDAPEKMWAQYQANEIKEVTNEVKHGRKILEWTWSNSNPVKAKRKDYSVYERDKEPGLAYSTFKSYAEIAEAYGVGARQKAVVTERVTTLANEITKDSKGDRDTAKALYEWVSKNIDYAGNCVGLGAVIPHSIDFILDNRIGDCKDHATLLQALLQTKGIPNTQALVNSGRTYQLEKIPVVTMVNHVINYIPGMNLYVDSTSTSTPFGMLPHGDEDKPVLLVDGFKEGTKTPATKPGTNMQTMKTVIHIQADGSAKAEVTADMKGRYAVSARSTFRDAPKDFDKEFVKNVLKGSRLDGDGTFSKDDPQALLDTYHYSAKFEIKNLLTLPGTGGFYITPIFYSEAPVMSWLAIAFADMDEAGPVSVCGNGYSEEETVYHLPKGMKILSMPEDIKMSNTHVDVKASYKLKGNVLTIKRVVDDKTIGNVCTKALLQEDKTLFEKLVPHFKSQVIYKM